MADTSIIRGSAFGSEKLDKTLAEYGFEASALSVNGFPPKAVWLVIEYYAYDSKAKALGVKQLARTFGQIGIMETFDKLSDKLVVPSKAVVNPALSASRDIKEIYDNIAGLSPTITQLLIDSTVNFYIDRQLPSAEFTPKYIAVVEIAKELGFKITKNNRSKLGTYVASAYREHYSDEPHSEKRLVNGFMQNVKVYEPSSLVNDWVREFFSQQKQ